MVGQNLLQRHRRAILRILYRHRLDPAGPRVALLEEPGAEVWQHLLARLLRTLGLDLLGGLVVGAAPEGDPVDPHEATRGSLATRSAHREGEAWA